MKNTQMLQIENKLKETKRASDLSVASGSVQEGRSSASPAEVFAEIWAEAEEVEFIEPAYD